MSLPYGQRRPPQLRLVDWRHVPRGAPDRLQWATPRRSSSGWLLGTRTGSLLLCGAGYLARWTPDRDHHRKVTVPPGWYAVEIRGHVLADDSDDGAYEFVLTPTPTRPAFRADLNQRLGLIDDNP